MKKKILATVLALILVLSASVAAYAESGVYTGKQPPGPGPLSINIDINS